VALQRLEQLASVSKMRTFLSPQAVATLLPSGLIQASHTPVLVTLQNGQFFARRPVEEAGGLVAARETTCLPSLLMRTPKDLAGVLEAHSGLVGGEIPEMTTESRPAEAHCLPSGVTPTA